MAPKSLNDRIADADRQLAKQTSADRFHAAYTRADPQVALEALKERSRLRAPDSSEEPPHHLYMRN